MSEKALSLLGMARRAGKLSMQEEANLSAIRSGRAKLLILAEDAGAATAKKYIDKCTYYRVPYVRVKDRTELGMALGTSPRSAVAVLDDGFANRLKELFLS
ncbi:L7Ae/L30e/S12e/Gadd45 family ribosomal protein [Dethiobacter alkaliphilus]|uniref:L7Ae/L30e/S12e/Gadd45 family ribosomal protein n=1 Tax=Dethiobacter alkaliphilus TaxID=427926 RepID=UPI002227B6C1|nr:ribosomal L7Ae/L30e/S12e/Gadd45 family protein [Dethiobacter alkaliphilus]MCW3490844.1 ribosomal L7Ae/L30e/S12e/Gadd45 family protein [Dethiobacter alkaliphilus]